MALTPLNVIGDPTNKDQAINLILTGKMDYYADRLPGRKLYGAYKTSTIAHGNIKLDASGNPLIDTSKALAEPGVKAVVTYKDVPTWTQGIFYWGQPVAGVVADDWFTAIRAASLITVQYDVAATVFDPDAAAQPGSPLSGGAPNSNTSTPSVVTRGDVNAGFTQSDVVVQADLPWTTTYQHNMLEPHGTVAWWVGDDLYFWTGSQDIHSGKNAVVNSLGIAANKVHAFTHGTGGGHGDKTGAPCGVPAAVMSKKVGGAAVQVVETRPVNMTTNTRQFDAKASIKMGAKNDGTLVACDVTALSNTGASGFFAIAFYGLQNSYTIPNYRHSVTTVFTNQPSRGAWRCVGDPPAAQEYDRVLDTLAEKLNMTPYDLRMKNLRVNPQTGAFDLPAQDAPNRVWGGIGLKDCFTTVYNNSGYATKWHKTGTKTLADGRMHGIAITGHLDSHGSVNGATRGGSLVITADGKALLIVGGARGSEGAETICTSIVAETLGMVYADVRVGEWGNTDVSITGGIQAGSGWTGGAGSAFYTVGQNARTALFTAALTKAPFNTISGITINDLDAKNSSVFLKSDPTKTLTYRQVMSGTAPIAVGGTGWAATLRSRSVGGLPIGTVCNTNGDAATCTEVAVDTETGQVEILGTWNAVDTGRTIYKNGTIKEMLSGCELQIAQSLFYGDVYDSATGALISSFYTEAMVPTAMDMNGGVFNVYDLESDDSAGPYGAHGIGEPCVTNASSITCAIYNATGVWVDFNHGAGTPNKILKALGKA